MNIVVTSYNRAGNCSTLDQIPKERRKRIYLCVYKKEAKKYHELYPDYEILVRPEGLHGLSNTRQWLCEYFCPQPLLMLDDDLRFYWRDAGLKHHPMDLVHWDRMIMAIMTGLGPGGFPHVSISFKWMNNTKTRSQSYCSRASAFHACDTKFVMANKIKWNRVENLQEPDFILQILKMGKRTMILNNFCHDQRCGMPGGCTVDRTIAILEKSAKEVNRLHPECTKLRTTTSYHCFKKQPVTDLRVQWQKAYKIGLAK